MKTIRTILFAPLAFIRLIGLLAVTAFCAFWGWAWMKRKGFSRQLQQRVLSAWGRSALFVLGVKVDMNQRPVDGNFILMPNHRSYIDIFIVACYTPSSMVAKAEMQNWPFLKAGFEASNTILVDRSDIKSMIKTLGRIKSSVSQGIPVTLFPEGTTYKGPLTKPFKNGSFKIAVDAQIPVVPMAIHFADVDDAWVDDDTFVGHFFRQMGKPVTKVYLRYGEQITSTDYKALQEETKNRIESMLTEIIKALN